jgi:hypothetical protein
MPTEGRNTITIGVRTITVDLWVAEIEDDPRDGRGYYYMIGVPDIVYAASMAPDALRIGDTRKPARPRIASAASLLLALAPRPHLHELRALGPQEPLARVVAVLEHDRDRHRDRGHVLDDMDAGSACRKAGKSTISPDVNRVDNHERRLLFPVMTPFFTIGPRRA